MKVKELIIKLIKLDSHYHKQWDKNAGILDDDFLSNLLFPKENNIEEIIMDFMNIPKDDYNEETDEGYCRDCISDDYWGLRDRGKYEEAYMKLKEEAELQKKEETNEIEMGQIRE